MKSSIKYLGGRIGAAFCYDFQGVIKCRYTKMNSGELIIASSTIKTGVEKQSKTQKGFCKEKRC